MSRLDVGCGNDVDDEGATQCNMLLTFRRVNVGSPFV